MKKTSFLLAFCLLVSVSAWAQKSESAFKIGLRAGVSTTDLKTEDLFSPSSENNFNLAIKQANYGYHFGLFARMGKKLYLQPEVLYNTSSVDYNFENFSMSGTVNQVLREEYRHLDIPLMLGLKFGFFRVQAGPVGHIYLNGSSELTVIEEYKESFEDLTLGWQGGLGFDFGRFLIDLKYEGNFDKFGNHINIGNQQYEFSQTPVRFIGTVGFSF